METRDGENIRDYLERIPTFAKEKSKVTDVRRFLERLGNPDRGFQIFHVAGTNGKGSVCAFLTSVLTEAGISTGTFTSPHLTDVRERFAVRGSTVEEDDFEATFFAVKDAVNVWMADGNPHPTYFEFLFYMAMELFSRLGMQALVLETGMGGLLDVTNVVEHPLVSIITSISLEHTGYLGHTLEEIAAHKAGIIKQGSPVVFDTSCAEAVRVIEETAGKLHSPAYPVGDVSYRFDETGLQLFVEYMSAPLTLHIPFSAPYQAVNAALAVRALAVSGLLVPGKILAAGIEKTVWPARMECIREGIYLDGAHNEGGVRAFIDAACQLKKQKKPRRVLLLFAVAADKEYHHMLQLIGERLKPDVWYLSQADSGRALPVEELLAAAGDLNGATGSVYGFSDTSAAFSALLGEKTKEDLAFIAGSLYLAGEIKARMKEEITDD